MAQALPRTLRIDQLLKKKSFFLFGPRGTGKSTLIRQQLKKAKVIDLLETNTLADYLKDPSLLPERNTRQTLIVIDEIQKVPQLLDEVHRMIELKKTRFLLTGSSARKLRRGGANLLAGRAWWAELFPLTSQEIPQFNLLKYLNTGGLPAIYGSANASEELRAYSNLYLKEEIQEEALIRKVSHFAEFLGLIALSNGEELNFQSLASDCGISPNSIKNYVGILEDTLIAFQLNPFRRTKKRKAISRSKIYFFDVGVVNYLSKRGKISKGSELFGKAFEHFLIQESRAYLSYARIDRSMMYWRSTSGFEVDLIFDSKWAFEIKGTRSVTDKHLKGLRALKEENIVENYGVISLDEEERKTKDGISILPWSLFLQKLWKGQLV